MRICFYVRLSWIQREEKKNLLHAKYFRLPNFRETIWVTKSDLIQLNKNISTDFFRFQVKLEQVSQKKAVFFANYTILWLWEKFRFVKTETERNHGK